MTLREIMYYCYVLGVSKVTFCDTVPLNNYASFSLLTMIKREKKGYTVEIIEIHFHIDCGY